MRLFGAQASGNSAAKSEILSLAAASSDSDAKVQSESAGIQVEWRTGLKWKQLRCLFEFTRDTDDVWTT